MTPSSPFCEKHPQLDGVRSPCTPAPGAVRRVPLGEGGEGQVRRPACRCPSASCAAPGPAGPTGADASLARYRPVAHPGARQLSPAADGPAILRRRGADRRRTRSWTDLRRRVAEKKAQGPLRRRRPDGRRPSRTTASRSGWTTWSGCATLAVQRVDIEVAASTKPVVGGAVSQVKRLLVRGTSQPMYGSPRSATAFNAALLAYLSALAREVAALRARRCDGDRAAADGRAERGRRSRAPSWPSLARAPWRERGRWSRMADAALPERIARLERGAAPAAAARRPPRGRAGAAATPSACAWRPPRRTTRARRADSRPTREPLADGAAVLHLGRRQRARALPTLGDGAEGVEAGRRARRGGRGRGTRRAARRPGRLPRRALAGLGRRDPGDRPRRAARRAGARRAGRRLGARPRAGRARDGRGPRTPPAWAIGGEFWRDPGRRRPRPPRRRADGARVGGLGTSRRASTLRGARRAGAGDRASVRQRRALGPRRYAVHAAR